MRTVPDHLIAAPEPDTVPLMPIANGDLEGWLAGRPPTEAAWVRRLGFRARVGETAAIPGDDGRLARVLIGLGAAPAEPWSFGGLPFGLPEGSYALDEAADAGLAEPAALGWALGGYAFARYRKPDRAPARLVWPAACDRAAVANAADATFLVRDLVNTPANDMGPAELAVAAEQLAGEFGADLRTVVGEDLLLFHYPAIHAVGRASSRAPRLIDLRWGAADAPKVTIVGKGVCFDTGGLDLKPSGGMKLMKKDMGGAAHALGLARMVMAAELPVRLRVLIPAVDNAVSGDAFRPLDVIRTRKGLSVEIGNTDAEGRLVLADALADAADETPDLLLDFATLTGAARVALGADLPALFCNDDPLAGALVAAGEARSDPMWRLPLWQPYAQQLKSPVADLSNVGENSFAGAILAALFLQRFVGRTARWAHLDVYAWNQAARPGRPKGGEAMGLRAAFAAIAERFSG
jgi:leucyl aminopeptidase